MSAQVPDAGKFIDYVWALREERDQLAADNKRMREALVKAEAMLSELDHIGEITEMGKAYMVEIRAALSTTANGGVAK